MVVTTMLPFTSPLSLERHAIKENLQKIRMLAELQPQYRLDIRYTAIDILQHVNNVNHIDGILDVFPLDFHDQFTPRELQINFTNEVVFGDRMKVLSVQEDNDQWVVVREKLPDRDRAFEISVAWKHG